jgi:hypothetical protein
LNPASFCLFPFFLFTLPLHFRLLGGPLTANIDLIDKKPAKATRMTPVFQQPGNQDLPSTWSYDSSSRNWDSQICLLQLAI